MEPLLATRKCSPSSYWRCSMNETNETQTETEKPKRKARAIAVTPTTYRLISEEAASRGISRAALLRILADQFSHKRKEVR